MYLKTPKRYTARGRRRNLINLRWLWLYLIAPPIIIAGALAWNFRQNLSGGIAAWFDKNVQIQINAPTLTPTLPTRDLEVRIQTTLENGNINDALDAMQALTDNEPNERIWHPILAQTLIMRNPTDPNQRQRAQQAAIQAINASPETPEGWVMMGLVMDWSDQSSQALGYALHAKELGDTTGMSSAVMAGVYVTLNDYKTASAMADEAIKANPNLAYAYYVRGQIAQFSGNAKEAIQWYKQGLEISKNDHKQWGGYLVIALSALYSAQNQLDAATSILTDAIPRDKDFAGLNYQLARIYYQKGEYAKSLETALSCVDRNPNYANCYVIITKAQYNDNLWEKASQAAQRAVDLGSTETSVYYYGGEAYRKLNRCPDAIKLFNAGLVLAEKQNKDVKSDFIAALADCGVVADTAIIPTATQIVVTATPRGKK